MELEGEGVTQSDRYGSTYQVRLKFGKQGYCVMSSIKAKTRRTLRVSWAS